MRAGSGPGLVPGAGQPGDDGSAGRAGGPAGGAWCRWGASSLHVMAGRSPVPDVAGAWGVRPSVGLGMWGCTVPEGRAAVVSVGVAVCACVGGAIKRRVYWVCCRLARCAMVWAGFRAGLCCCRLAGCRPRTVCRRDGWCYGCRASCGALGRFTGGGSGWLPRPAGCGAPARAVVRAGSGPGLVPGAGRPGHDGSAGRAGGPAGGAWRRWGASPLHVMAGRSPVPDVAGAWGVRPSVGLGMWGCTVPEGRAAVVSVGVAVCACVGGPSSGVCTGSAAGRPGVPWFGRGSGRACVAAAWLAAGRGPCAGVTAGVIGVGLPVGLWAGSLYGCAVPGGCSGWVPTAPVFVGLGVVPLLAGDARCPLSPVVVLCCVGCRCAARLDTRSCRGLCGAGSPIVCVASLACGWCGAATGVGGAEVDGLGDVEDVASDFWARTFVALVAAVARDPGGRVVMVAVVLWEQ